MTRVMFATRSLASTRSKGVSDAEREAAWRRIKAAAKKFGLEIHVKSWRELMKGGKTASR